MVCTNSSFITVFVCIRLMTCHVLLCWLCHSLQSNRTSNNRHLEIGLGSHIYFSTIIKRKLCSQQCLFSQTTCFQSILEQRRHSRRFYVRHGRLQIAVFSFFPFFSKLYIPSASSARLCYYTAQLFCSKTLVFLNALSQALFTMGSIPVK